MEASPEMMEPNPEEKEAVVERQEIPNEEAAVHSLRACRRETDGVPINDGGTSGMRGANLSGRAI
jgi:hypothetical protein